jgi:hypothetical protein
MFVGALHSHDMVGSMGKVGAACDNAAMESILALLKKNVLDRRTWATRQELRIATVTWTERTYHRAVVGHVLRGRGWKLAYGHRAPCLAGTPQGPGDEQQLERKAHPWVRATGLAVDLDVEHGHINVAGEDRYEVQRESDTNSSPSRGPEEQGKTKCDLDQSRDQDDLDAQWNPGGKVLDEGGRQYEVRRSRERHGDGHTQSRCSTWREPVAQCSHPGGCRGCGCQDKKEDHQDSGVLLVARGTGRRGGSRRRSPRLGAGTPNLLAFSASVGTSVAKVLHRSTCDSAAQSPVRRLASVWDGAEP